MAPIGRTGALRREAPPARERASKLRRTSFSHPIAIPINPYFIKSLSMSQLQARPGLFSGIRHIGPKVQQSAIAPTPFLPQGSLTAYSVLVQSWWSRVLGAK